MRKQYTVYQKITLPEGKVELIEVRMPGNGFMSEDRAERSLLTYLNQYPLMKSETFLIIPEYSYSKALDDASKPFIEMFDSI